MTPRVGVVIPAAGTGRRMGSPKALLDLAGRPMLRWTLDAFLPEARVEHIVVALGADLVAAPPGWLLAEAPRVRFVEGGRDRGDSVHAALQTLGEDVDVVLVHDAARPLVPAEVIDRTIAEAAAGRCVVAAIPAADTLQEVDSERRIVATPDRGRLWQAQTPQAFPRAVLLAAYDRAAHDGVRATDDAALVARYGSPVFVVEGDARNFKITVPSDVQMAESLLAPR